MLFDNNLWGLSCRSRHGGLLWYFGGAIQWVSHQLSVSLNLFVFHTRPTTHNPLKSNQKIPKDSPLRWGSAPSLSLWDGYRLRVIKAFVMLPCCKSLLLKHNGKRVKSTQQKSAFSMWSFSVQTLRLIIDSRSKQAKSSRQKIYTHIKNYLSSGHLWLCQNNPGNKINDYLWFT